MMKLKTFCGCFSLKSGAITIGCLTSVFALCSVICYSVFFGVEDTDIDDGSYYLAYKAAEAAVIMTYTMVIAATGILMIHGAQEGNADFTFPWLARATTDLMIVPSLIFTYIVISPMYFQSIDETFFINLAVSIVGLALYMYTWLVIYSFYKQLIAEKCSCKDSSNEEKVPKKSLNIYYRF